MSAYSSETSSLLTLDSSSRGADGGKKQKIIPHYNSLEAAHEENYLPTNDEDTTTNDRDTKTSKHKDIVHLSIMNLMWHLVFPIGALCLAIIIAILAMYQYFNNSSNSKSSSEAEYKNEDVQIDDDSLVFYLHASVCIGLLGTISNLVYVCLALKNVCSVSIIPTERMTYMKSQRMDIPTSYVTLDRLPIIRALVFVFISLIYVMFTVSLSMALLYFFYSGSIGQIWLVLLPLYMVCFTCLAYMILVKGFKVLQICLLILGIIESFLVIHKIEYMYSISWFVFCSPIIIMQAILALGIAQFMYENVWNKTASRSNHVAATASTTVSSAWRTVGLCILLLLSSVWPEVLVISEEYHLTNSLFSCATSPSSYSENSIINHKNKSISFAIAIVKFLIYNPIFFVVISVILSAFLLYHQVCIELDILLKSNGNSIPRVLFRTWSGWNLQEEKDNLVLDV